MTLCHSCLFLTYMHAVNTNVGHILLWKKRTSDCIEAILYLLIFLKEEVIQVFIYHVAILSFCVFVMTEITPVTGHKISHHFPLESALDHGHPRASSVGTGQVCSRRYVTHKIRLTVREDIVVCYRGRWEAALRPFGVLFLQSEPLPVAVDPGSPPHCGRGALHRLGSQTARGHGGGRSCRGTRTTPEIKYGQYILVCHWCLRLITFDTEVFCAMILYH